MTPPSGNILKGLPADASEEVFELLHQGKGVTIERIFSNGQATPEGEWLNQDWDEWVIVMQGKGELLYENGTKHSLRHGDFLLIPSHQKHRVTHTEPHTVWLAIHLKKGTA